MKLNNKGYLIIEIVMASMIAFGVAYFLFDLTLNMKNKSDNIQARTIIMTDRAIIENYIMSQFKEADVGTFSCYTSDCIEFKKNNKTNRIYLITESESNKRKIVHYSYSPTAVVYKKEFNKYVNDNNVKLTCNNENDTITITITMSDKLTGESYDINLTYVK